MRVSNETHLLDLSFSPFRMNPSSVAGGKQEYEERSSLAFCTSPFVPPVFRPKSKKQTDRMPSSDVFFNSFGGNSIEPSKEFFFAKNSSKKKKNGEILTSLQHGATVKQLDIQDAYPFTRTKNPFG